MALAEEHHHDGVNAEDRPSRMAAILVVLLVTLAVLGAGGAVLFGVGAAHASKPAATPARAVGTFAPLPPMEFSLADGPRTRTVNLRVVLELGGEVDKSRFEHQASRITGELGTRMVELHPDELRGADGTRMVKDVLTVAANRELRPLKVRQVLLQEMVLR